jgi:DNA-binding XRE family transcriptional regulator
MPAQILQHALNGLVELMRLERLAFAAKLRMTRALIGWSQTELAQHVGLTQRSVHKLEQGETEPRRATVRAIKRLWSDQGIEFEDLPDGFNICVRSRLLEGPLPNSAQLGSPAQMGDASGEHQRVSRPLAVRGGIVEFR